MHRRNGNKDAETEGLLVPTRLTEDPQNLNLHQTCKRTVLVLLALFTSLWACSYLWAGHRGSKLSIFSQCRHVRDTAATKTSPCVSFRPSVYFFGPNQPGQRYQRLVEKTASTIRLSMWGKQVSTFRSDASRPNDFLLKRGITSVSTVMIPKVASRSVDSLFLERLCNRKKSPRVGIATAAFWKQLAQTNRENDIVFCLLRNPVGRFLSSLAQILSSPMQRKCSKCSQVLEPCIDTSDSYQQLIRCTIDTMKNSGDDGFFDVHLVPQAVFLAGSLGESNIEVSIFSMDHGGLGDVLNAFGSVDQHKNTREEKDFAPNVLTKFGDELYDSHKARAVLDDSIVKDICKLYQMDVDMMKFLGFAVRECD